MAVEDKVVSSQEGIIDDDIDQTIRNLALIGNKGMTETDKIVLDIMTKNDCFALLERNELSCSHF